MTTYTFKSTNKGEVTIQTDGDELDARGMAVDKLYPHTHFPPTFTGRAAGYPGLTLLSKE
jgi:hypothetical protein